MKKTLLGALSLCAISFASFGQQRHCAADEVLQNQLAKDPSLAQKMAKVEQHANEYAQARKAGRLAEDGVTIIIPCVVTVVYANAQQNISDAQIQSQIDRLNYDYATTNADYNNAPSEFAGVRSGDTQVRFELEQVRRYSNSKTSWGTNDAVKTTYPPVSPENKLNLWVANIGNSILGYAQFPGGSLSTDGVVISPNYFGDAYGNGTTRNSSFYLSAPFDRGRTGTHEVGHWLNLRHIWGDGGCSADDFVADTPLAGASNYGCPAYPTNSCSSAGNDMTMNYMDYTDDACMYMFSAGQKDRMRALFATGGARAGFATGGSTPPPPPTSCTNNEVTLTLTFDQYPAETSWTLKNSSGATVDSGNGYSTANSTITKTFCLPNGTYTFTINDSYGDGICCSYGNGSYNIKDASNTTLASGGTFTSSDSKTFTVGGTTPPPSCGVPSGLASSSIAETSFTLTWAAVSGAASYDVEVNGQVLNTTAATLNLTGATAGTAYTCKVRANCSGATSAYSSAITVTTLQSTGGTAPTGYCASKGNSVADEWIQRVQVGTINNNSGANGGYGNFTNLSTNMAKGSSYTITITPGWSGSAYREAYNVWIDYNRDGDFADAGELVYSRSRSTTTPVSGSFTVPTSASNGLTRMRVTMKYNANATSCETFSYGEVEDYLVNIGSSAREAAPTTAQASEMAAGPEVAVYPNPADVATTISVSVAAVADVNITVYDMQGREVYRKQLVAVSGNVDEQLNVSSYKAGLYLVTVTTSEGHKEVRKLQVK